jgi:hypothetical protein
MIDQILEGTPPEDVRDEDRAVQRVLEDSRIKILLEGYDMHDRSEGLESVIERDIRQKVRQALRRRGASP